MMEWYQDRSSRPDEGDEVVAEALRHLDPASVDPNYWMRFRSWVVESASTELARRRLMADLTVGDVLSSWARPLMPAALAAAAVAGMMLARVPTPPSPAPLAIEELLVSELDDEPIPAALGTDEAGPAVAFAAERF